MRFLKIILFSLFVSCSIGTICAVDDKLFEYPVIPEEKNILSERCNYLVYHFWDKANLTSMFSSRQKLNRALGDWFGFMPYATTDTIHLSIDRLIANVSKNPKNMLALAEMAKGWTYSDTAEIGSEELYLPFAQAVRDNKKISKADKAPYISDARIIESSGLGATIPSAVKFLSREGQTIPISEVMGNTVLIMFVDPEKSDSRLEAVRLSADPHIKDLVATGRLTVVAIYPSHASDSWNSMAAAFPENWYVGTMADAADYFDVSYLPSYFYLDRTHKVIAKNLAVEQILHGAASINMRKKR